MGLKKIARPINKVKNTFIKWLKDNNAEDIDEFEGKVVDDGFDYYRQIDAFIGETMYNVCFTMWMGEVKISYDDEENQYKNMSLEEFLELIN